jgi:UDP-N-acetylglucosamine 2-epimerase (non-hydrolysing)
MRRMEPELTSHRPDAVVVVGDVNSTASAAIAAVKMGLPVAHVEAGLRSFDRTMPEETNRILTDSISTWLFASEPSGVANLRREGVAEERIYFVGNVMIDTLLRHRERARACRAYARLGLEPGGYAVMTLHRPSNVDVPERLEAIVRAAEELSHRLKIVFLVHPRTQERLRALNINREAQSRFLLSDPLGYLEMLSLQESARFVMTDSGGIQEETTALGIPCLTLRENTERPVTLEQGTNTLVPSRTESILKVAQRILKGGPVGGRMPEKWDGRASERIAEILKRNMAEQGAA